MTTCRVESDVFLTKNKIANIYHKANKRKQFDVILQTFLRFFFSFLTTDFHFVVNQKIVVNKVQIYNFTLKHKTHHPS